MSLEFQGCHFDVWLFDEDEWSNGRCGAFGSNSTGIFPLRSSVCQDWRQFEGLKRFPLVSCHDLQHSEAASKVQKLHLHPESFDNMVRSMRSERGLVLACQNSRDNARYEADSVSTIEVCP